MFNPTQPSAGNIQRRNMQAPTALTLFDQFISAHAPNAIHDQKKIKQFLFDRFRDLQQQHDDGEALSVFVGDSDVFLNAVENHRGSPVRGMRYTARKEAFGIAIANAGNKPFDLVQCHLSIPHFNGKNHMVIEYAREKIEHAVRARYRLPTGSQHPSLVRRFTTQQLQRVTQGDYILHVCGLFNLENKINPAQWSDFLAQLDNASRRTIQMSGPSNQWTGKKYKDVICKLVGAFAGQQGRGLHNLHPASRLLESCSGFVFHPNRNNHAQDLLNSASPASFDQISRTLALKYFDAVQSNRLNEFFEEAFQRTDPCYEATVENILGFEPVAAKVVIFHPKPQWIDNISAEDNINGLLAWSERELLKDYASAKNIELTEHSLKQIDDILSSKDFASFLNANQDVLHQHVLNSIKPGNEQILKTLLAEYVADSLSYAKNG